MGMSVYRGASKVNIMKNNNFNELVGQSMRRSLKRNKSGYIWERVVGVTLFELKKHIEKQFDKKMSWENYGKYWVIDKIIPLSAFNSNEEIKKIWSLKNLRPYPRALRNARKQGIDWKLIEEHNLYDILPIGQLGEPEWLKEEVLKKT